MSESARDKLKKLVTSKSPERTHRDDPHYEELRREQSTKERYSDREPTKEKYLEREPMRERYPERESIRKRDLPYEYDTSRKLSLEREIHSWPADKDTPSEKRIIRKTEETRLEKLINELKELDLRIMSDLGGLEEVVIRLKENERGFRNKFNLESRRTLEERWSNSHRALQDLILDRERLSRELFNRKSSSVSFERELEELAMNERTLTQQLRDIHEKKIHEAALRDKFEKELKEFNWRMSEFEKQEEDKSRSLSKYEKHLDYERNEKNKLEENVELLKQTEQKLRQTYNSESILKKKDLETVAELERMVREKKGKFSRKRKASH